ncbi:MAG: DNA polymerase [Janthinobacterium lividum]
MDVSGELRAAGAQPGDLLGLVVVDGGAGFAHGDRRWGVAGDPVRVVAFVEAALHPRWTWWSAARTAAPIVAAGVHLARCHDVAAVHRLLAGGARDDPGAAWAAGRGLPEPPPPSYRRAAMHGTGLLDFVGAATDDDPLDADGQLKESWVQGQALAADVPDRVEKAARWAQLALQLAREQTRAVNGHPDPRRAPAGAPLAAQTAHSESAAALLAVELGVTGLPLQRATAEEIVAAEVGPRPANPVEEREFRARRDAPVQTALGHVDLRNPAQVLAALHSLGFDVPDTRAWRLERLRGAHPAVEALLHWRKSERLSTTYGYHWLDTQVGGDGRLRGTWSASDAAAGRMTAQAGLHNLPAELRPAVAAEPGHLLVRADLGQVEPRVLAAVSHDTGLTAATLDDDLYAPVAEALRADRPTAKIAVLAAMYGQTSGAAGEALRSMERTYPTALGYLRSAEDAGRTGRDVRTYGGRLIRLAELAAGDTSGAFAARGRFARNAVVQGAAAELFKAWAATVRAGLVGSGGQIVLCLHDELLLHVPARNADGAAQLLVTALEQTAGRWAAGSGVRFVADVSIVHRWSEAK